MSNDPDQEVFVDGLTEDLITDLSRASGLFVIASNSVFAYKGKHADVRRIALRRPETYRATSRRLLTASLARLGRLDEARTEAQLFMMSNPKFTIRQWSGSQRFRDEELRRHFVEGYRMAGLPQ